MVDTQITLASEFGWGASDLALNFTLAMTFFCVGGLLGAQMSKRFGHRTALLTAGALSALGFVLTSLLNNTSVAILYITYGVLACLGICISFLAAVGSSVISFAKDLALSVDAPEALAVSLVGVLSVCNGVGRIITGAVFDIIGRRKTMLCANILTIGAAAVTLMAVNVNSLVLCIVGVCLTGMSYGACPTITAAFTSSFYGMKHFPNNMAFMTFTVMVGSFVATASNKVLEATGGYTGAFVMLLALTGVSLLLNVFIRKP